MLKKTISFQTKSGAIASLDLLFSLIIFLSFLLPILNFTTYTSTLTNNTEKNNQKLSILLQLSEHFYTDLAAKKITTGADTYSLSGVLSPTFIPNQKYDFENLGLSDFSILSSPPKIYSKNQICVNRLMLTDSNISQNLWFCTG